MFLAFFPYFFSLLLLPFSLFYCKLFILFFFIFLFVLLIYIYSFLSNSFSFLSFSLRYFVRFSVFLNFSFSQKVTEKSNTIIGKIGKTRKTLLKCVLFLRLFLSTYFCLEFHSDSFSYASVAARD